MPLPTPRAGEKSSEFHSRCMANPHMREKFKDPQQRNAVCYSQEKKNYRRPKK